MESQLERIDAALGSMTLLGPRGLSDYLQQPTPDFSAASPSEVSELIDLILSDDPNHLSRLRFSSLLREWDNSKEPSWGAGTSRNTLERRARIHELLKSDDSLRNRIEAMIPFFRLEEPLIILEEHKDWYEPRAGLHDYYWQTYKRYLEQKKKWPGLSLMALDNTTRAVLECLSNPESAEAYASRGLVMGYVQSGKTANFAGVIARAADAGYRLIVVMAGTWNILRNQTQRRLDKELLGKELLQNDELYLDPHPRDWNEFLEHGFDPIQRGHYGWQRLTRPDIDFKSLKSAIDNLEFERRDQSLPLYHPTNLHKLPVKLLVVKKHSGILAKLARDLKLIKTKLADLPALFVDDESDQAGLNTINPGLWKDSQKERSKTNKVIVELLGLFPRGQYIGYTATPYANAFVDLDDPEDLFPKDFIVSLERPAGYMGVSDFFDPDVDFSDLDHDDYSQREIAFIRRVSNAPGADDVDLQDALRSYVLSGAVKLYRQAKDFKSYSFRHHTMLIHTSSSTVSQADLAERVMRLWNGCAFNTPSGVEALKKLWDDDYSRVSLQQAPKDLIPQDFSELIPFLADTIDRIERGSRCVMVVNYSSKEAPDFGEGPVWKIIVGGNKLSRGYTVEGLTISYYRRAVSTADTLMQMGRWFGFRQGYQDLVRVFLGINEGKKGNIDLVGMFKQVCVIEERFRQEISRYVRAPGKQKITPQQIPPLVSVIGQMPPTSRNKMFNAKVTNRNYGGRWSQPTLIAATTGLTKNLGALHELLEKAKFARKETLGGKAKAGVKTKLVSADSWVFEATNDAIIKFLTDFRWEESRFKYPERPIDIDLQIDFLERQQHGISSWLIVAPQRGSSYGLPEKIKKIGELTVKRRRRLEGKIFQNFGEPAHRLVAESLTEQSKVEKDHLIEPNSKTRALIDSHRGVVLVYLVRESESDEVSVGYEMLYPRNNLDFNVTFTVHNPAEAERVIVRT